MFGFMNINKPKGMTSFDVVAMLRKKIGIKKIGHAGTLDPSAKGVLPVALGKATRLIDYLPKEKIYLVKFRLGFKSPSFDCDTELKKVSDEIVSRDKLEMILEDFKGEIIQKPPVFSAVKVKGKRLYEYARKNSDVDIPARRVVVESIELSDFDGRDGSLLIKCSKGTYIRSIINDMGEKLKTGAVMTDLTRLKSGGMSIENSVSPDFSGIENPDDFVVSPDKALNFPCFELSEKQFLKVRHGNSTDFEQNNGMYFLTYKKEPVALAEIIDKKAKIKLVFCE